MYTDRHRDIHVGIDIHTYTEGQTHPHSGKGML